MGTKEFNILDIFIARLRLRQINKYIGKNKALLDFGCGYQYMLLKTFQKSLREGVGIDYDVPKNSSFGNISLIKLNAQNHLPFPDKHFDIITMLAVLEHINLDSVEKLFLEFKRVLKDEGNLVLTTPTPKSKNLLEFLAFRMKLISQAEIADHKKYYGRSDIQELAEQVGLKVEKYDTFQFGFNSISVLKKSI